MGEFDLKDGVWTISAKRMKGGTTGRVRMRCR